MTLFNGFLAQLDSRMRGNDGKLSYVIDGEPLTSAEKKVLTNPDGLARMSKSTKTVIPAKAGIQKTNGSVPRLRFPEFRERIECV